MGSPGGGGPGGSGGPSGDNGGRGSDEDSRTSSKSESSQAGMTGSERTQEAAFNEAMDNECANQPGGPEFGDTTPGYSGPIPDPRGPTLDNGPDDRDNENSKPAAANPGGLPDSDTTPGYAGPVPDPRGPTLSDGEEDEKSALAMAGTVALGFAAADGPVSPIGDIIGLGVGLGILGYAGYQAMTGPPAPVMNENTEGSPDDKTVGGHNVGDLTSSGTEPDLVDKSGDLTKAGRALDKHGNRPGSVFDKPSGTPADKNAEGQKALEDIVNDENATVKEGNRFGGFDVYDSDGKGARFDEDGKFQGFLEPPRH